MFTKVSGLAVAAALVAGSTSSGPLTDWPGRKQAVASAQSATQAEFREQARVCGVSAKFRAGQTVEARLSTDGKELSLRDTRSNGRQLQCMLDWAKKRHLVVSLLQS